MNGMEGLTEIHSEIKDVPPPAAIDRELNNIGATFQRYVTNIDISMSLSARTTHFLVKHFLFRSFANDIDRIRNAEHPTCRRSSVTSWMKRKMQLKYWTHHGRVFILSASEGIDKVQIKLKKIIHETKDNANIRLRMISVFQKSKEKRSHWLLGPTRFDNNATLMRRNR